MASKILGFGIAGLVSAAVATPGFAGQATSCYERYRTDPVIGSIEERVLLHPASRQEFRFAAIVGTRQRLVYSSPEYVSERRVAARYATIEEPVRVRSARTVLRTIPAVTRTVYEKIRVNDGGYIWEWRTIDGRRVLCKVKQPAHWRSVPRTVVVTPARTVRETLPEEWGSRTRTVLVTPEHSEQVLNPAESSFEIEPTVIQPEIVAVVDAPPSTYMARRDVVLQEGRSGWRPVTIPRHCR
jgi:hypothetical protein